MQTKLHHVFLPMLKPHYVPLIHLTTETLRQQSLMCITREKNHNNQKNQKNQNLFNYFQIKQHKKIQYIQNTGVCE